MMFANCTWCFKMLTDLRKNIDTAQVCALTCILYVAKMRCFACKIDVDDEHCNVIIIYHVFHAVTSRNKDKIICNIPLCPLGCCVEAVVATKKRGYKSFRNVLFISCNSFQEKHGTWANGSLDYSVSNF